MLFRIDHQPSRGKLAVFGLSWLIFLGLLSAGLGRRGSPGAAVAVGLAAAAVPLIGLVSVRWLRAVYLAANYATYPLSVVASYVILAVVFYAVVTPLGLALRLLGHDPLGRRFDPQAKSYWSERKPPEDTERYFEQF
jgi:hypothetical protein